MISSAGSEKCRQHHSKTALANKNRQALAFVYCEDEPGRRTTAKLLKSDEARRWCSGQPYMTQTPPCHRAHLRTARRAWRVAALDTQTPLTITLPAPQPMRACVIMPSG
jgi:hypothetical protein